MFHTETTYKTALLRTTTENGQPSLLSTGNPLLDLSVKLVRGLEREELRRLVAAVLSCQENTGDGLKDQQSVQNAVDLFVLWAATRDVRQGKGEGRLSHWLLLELYATYPEAVMQLLPLIPHYGSWKDVKCLMGMPDVPPELALALTELMATQLRRDADRVSESEFDMCDIPATLGAGGISLCAKWAPRRKSAHAAAAKLVTQALFPGEQRAAASYRKLLSQLNKHLGTVEIDMCGENWQGIDPTNVPARCLHLNRLAFLNKPAPMRLQRADATKIGLSFESATRAAARKERSTSTDRRKCARHFEQQALEALKDSSRSSLHGRVLHPHELVRYYMKPFSTEDVIVEAQWANLRERLAVELPALCHMVPMVDVSGSMAGTPMQVAVALGILITELSQVAGANNGFITFSNNPKWHRLQPGLSLHEKVQSSLKGEWGGSTNISKAMDMVLMACIDGDLAPEDVGKLSLIVLSDMQFDRAISQVGPIFSFSPHGGYNTSLREKPSHVWETQYEQITAAFKAAGLRSRWARAYPVPRIIFWNLRGDTSDFAVAADTPGVHALGGFSANMLKQVMADDGTDCLDSTPIDTTLEQQNTTAENTVTTPEMCLRKLIDDPRYDAVRTACSLCFTSNNIDTLETLAPPPTPAD